MSIIIIGTHDIQDVTASSLHPGQIRVVGDYVDGSAATGVLLILYSLTNDSDVLYIAKQKEQNATVRLILFIIIGTLLPIIILCTMSCIKLHFPIQT